MLCNIFSSHCPVLILVPSPHHHRVPLDPAKVSSFEMAIVVLQGRHCRLAILVALGLYASLSLIYLRGSVPLRRGSSSTTTRGYQVPAPLPDDEVELHPHRGDRDGRRLIDVKRLLGELAFVNKDNVEDLEAAVIEGAGELRMIEDEKRSAKRILENQPQAGEEAKRLLGEVFEKIDGDRDGQLGVEELARWIHGKIVEHVERATRENVVLFTMIDNDPRNGEVSWNEYHAYFLRKHGVLEDHESAGAVKRKFRLDKPLRVAIMRDRAHWFEAARDDPDRLGLDEFLAFTHPESSHRALLQAVDELFEKFDQDGDEQLTEEEFAEFPADGTVRDHRNVSATEREERREEFKRLIDKNGDGRAGRAELLAYIDPRNPRHALQESRHLVDLADGDRDGRLRLPEMLAQASLFLDSKVFGAESSFHDEFRR